MPTINRNHGVMRTNDSEAIPRYIVILATTKTDRAVCGIPDSSNYRLDCACCLVIRISKGKARLHGRLSTSSKSELWQFLADSTGNRYTTWIVSNDMLKAFMLIEGPAIFEQSKWVVDWPRSKRKKTEDDKAKAATSPFVVIAAPPVIIAAKCVQTQGRAVFVDILNWYRSTLSEIATSLKIEPPNLTNCKDASERNQRLAEWQAIITANAFLAVIDFVKDNDCGMFRYTASSQAMSAFRHGRMPCKIFPHDNLDIKAFERRAYIGGRVECFYTGTITEDVHYLDCNSLYPSVMQNNLFPYVLDSFDNGENGNVKEHEFDSSRSIASCTVETVAPIYPKRIGNHTYYPIGKFRTILAGPELAAASRRKEIVSIERFAQYGTKNLFTQFVRDFIAIRNRYKQSGEKINEQLAKLFANSLYGKFGQWANDWVTIPSHDCPDSWAKWSAIDPDTGEIVSYRSFAWQVQRQQKRTEKKGNFIAISAFVTAYGRMRMNWLKAIAKPINTFYQAVDGLIVNSEGYANLKTAGEVHDTELGKLRLELSTNYGEIRGCNDYRMGGKVVLSSRSRDTVMDEFARTMQIRRYAASRLFNHPDTRTVQQRTEQWQRSAERPKILPDKCIPVAPLCLDEN